MKYKWLIFIFLLFIGAVPNFSYGAEPAETAPLPDDLNAVLSQVEKKYATGFCARFVQMSTIKAMDISDTATGKICAKSPGMMRWEYEAPSPQLIITNGKKLWVYRPEDNQVMLGESPIFFEGGKGAGFLSDIKLLRGRFDISLEKAEDPSIHLLKLIPRDKKLEISTLYLYVAKEDASLTRIITFNTYEDETRVDLFDHQFNVNMDDAIFNFVVPEGTDVLQLDE